MKRRGVLRRSAAAGLALATASSIITVATGQAASATTPEEPARAAVRGTERADVVPGRYIVVLKDQRATYTSVRALAATLTRANGGNVRQVFGTALSGFSASMSTQQAEKVAANPAVAYVEQVRRVSASGTQSNPPSWGLDRLDQASAKLNKSFKYPNTGSNVTAYIVDTGINTKHQDFGGRASIGFDYFAEPPVDPEPEPTTPDPTTPVPASEEDCDGHGTHVAGTVGGAKYGVAKQVKLVGVRVLDCDGWGTTDSVIAGINFVTEDAKKNAPRRAVANVSLGGGVSSAIDAAVRKSIDSGVTFAIAAGNESQNACNVSPARVPDAITVGATDRIDMRAWFSNYGKCLDVFAPGVSIVSARHDNNTGTVGMSGTSMAAPHVAGAAALLLHSNPTWKPKQVRDRIVTTGLAGAVYDPKGSMDRLLTVGSVTQARNGYGLKASSNGKFVTAASTKKALVNNGSSLGTAQRYDVVNAGSGLVALRSKNTGRYVVAPSKGTKPLIASHKTIVNAGKFTIVHHTDGTVSLKAKANGKFVTAAKSGKSSLKASKTSVGSSEKFTFDAPAPVVTIKAKASNRYVVAGSKPLIATSKSVTKSTKFQMVNRGNGFFYLKALANNRYVIAASKGTKPLIANSKSTGTYQTFDFLDYNADGTVYLGARDGQAVTAGKAGNKQLISSKNINWNREDLGLGNGEKFFFAIA
ncbi:S8 family serine peptidase [Micromonospora sp. NPDC049903]|uniref:S8 family serine peptidase n=1 Tax=Micromonospora sp. NPDC049903 TaxID=3364276 RepID=UPI0037B45C18